MRRLHPHRRHPHLRSDALYLAIEVAATAARRAGCASRRSCFWRLACSDFPRCRSVWRRPRANATHCIASWSRPRGNAVHCVVGVVETSRDRSALRSRGGRDYPCYAMQSVSGGSKPRCLRNAVRRAQVATTCHMQCTAFEAGRELLLAHCIAVGVCRPLSERFRIAARLSRAKAEVRTGSSDPVAWSSGQTEFVCSSFKERRQHRDTLSDDSGRKKKSCGSRRRALATF
jgi:hypothetical protein